MNVVTRQNAMGGGGGMGLLEGTVNPYRTSKLSKIQEFYGLKYEELFDIMAMMGKKVNKEDLKYIMDNRDFEFATKDTVGYELRKGVFQSVKFKKLQEFYGFTLEDTQDVDKLKKLGVNSEDIMYITGTDVDKVAVEPKTLSKEAVKRVADAKTDDLADPMTEIEILRDKHKAEFGRYPSKNIKLSTLKKKLGVKN